MNLDTEILEAMYRNQFTDLVGRTSMHCCFVISVARELAVSNGLEDFQYVLMDARKNRLQEAAIRDVFQTHHSWVSPQAIDSLSESGRVCDHVLRDQPLGILAQGPDYLQEYRQRLPMLNTSQTVRRSRPSENAVESTQ